MGKSARWVIAVGATRDPEGMELASYSSVGTAGIDESGPDVVAWGASAVDPSVVGTSFAAPRVASLCLVLYTAMLQLQTAISTFERGNPIEGIRLAGIGLVDSPFGAGGPRSVA